MDATGEYVLSDLFPRTWLVAGAEMSLLSAAKRHRDTLPNRRDVLHLFGEPFPAFREASAWLSELKTGGDSSLLSALRTWNASNADAELRLLVGEPSSGERIGEVLRLGALPADSLNDRRALDVAAKALAAAYLGQDKNLVIPYFDLA